MQSYALFLDGYNYDIVYRNTKKHGNADCLPHLPVKSESTQLANRKEEAELEMFHVSQLEHLPEAMQGETCRYYLLSKVCDNVTRRIELTSH